MRTAMTPHTDCVSVVIVAPLRVARDSIARELACAGLEVISAHGNVQDGQAMLTKARPDVILLDADVAEDGAAVRRLLDSEHQAAIVVFGTRSADARCVGCARAGAAGYIDADSPVAEWGRAVHAALRGEIENARAAGLLNRALHELGKTQSVRTPRSDVAIDPPSETPANEGLGWRISDRVKASAERARLTAREKQILSLIDQGMSNKEIAVALGVETSTVKNHVHSILGKYQVRRRTHAVACFRRGADSETG